MQQKFRNTASEINFSQLKNLIHLCKNKLCLCFEVLIISFNLLVGTEADPLCVAKQAEEMILRQSSPCLTILIIIN